MEETKQESAEEARTHSLSRQKELTDERIALAHTMIASAIRDGRYKTTVMAEPGVSRQAILQNLKEHGYRVWPQSCSDQLILVRWNAKPTNPIAWFAELREDFLAIVPPLPFLFGVLFFVVFITWLTK